MSHEYTLDTLNLSDSEKAIIASVPEVTKRQVIKSFSEVAMHNPEKAKTLTTDILQMLIALAPQSNVTAEDLPEPAMVSTFWEVWERLVENGHLRNHSYDTNMIAVNLPEFIGAAREIGYIFPRNELRRALPQSRKYPLIKGNKKVFSVVTRKSLGCWVFQRVD